MVAANSLIGRYSIRKQSFLTSKSIKQKPLEPTLRMDLPSHLSIFLEARNCCQYHKNEGLDDKTCFM